MRSQGSRATVSQAVQLMEYRVGVKWPRILTPCSHALAAGQGWRIGVSL